MKNFLLLFACVHFTISVQGQDCISNLNPNDSIFGLYPDSLINMNCYSTSEMRTIISKNIETVTVAGQPVTYQFDGMKVFSVSGLPNGFDLITVGTDSIAAHPPYGIWQQVNASLINPRVTGCFSFSATEEEMVAASFGGINNQGLYEIEVLIGFRVESTSIDLSFIGIGPGTWTDNVPQNIGASDTLNFLLQVTPTACPTDMIAIASTQPNNEAMDTCNGSASVQVYYGTPPYSFYFSSGESDGGASVQGLCTGTHQVIVTDAAGSEYVSSFIISSAANVLDNPPGLLDSLLLPDVLVNFSDPIEMCELDFTSAVDSFQVIGTVLYDNGIALSPPYDLMVALDSDSAVASWTLYQNGQAFDTSVTYYGIEVLNCIFELSVFCLNGRAEFGSFQMFAAVNLNDLVGISNISYPPITLHPNPTSSLLRFTTELNSPYSITDMVGRTMQRGMVQAGSNDVQVTALPDGIYLFRLEGSGSSARFVKTGR
jgi:hypothetical protein